MGSGQKMSSCRRNALIFLLGILGIFGLHYGHDKIEESGERVLPGFSEPSNLEIQVSCKSKGRWFESQSSLSGMNNLRIL